MFLQSMDANYKIIIFFSVDLRFRVSVSARVFQVIQIKDLKCNLSLAVKAKYCLGQF